MVLLFVGDAISLSALINFSLGLVGLIVLSTIGAAVLNFAENPSKGKSFLIGLVALLLVFGISYGAAQGTMTEDGALIPGSQLAEAGIYTLYAVVFIALAALLYSSGKRVIR